MNRSPEPPLETMNTPDNRQWRFVFNTLADEASLYSLVTPQPTSASSETVDPEDHSITVNDYFRIMDPDRDWPMNAPRVSVQVDQRSGQVNVRVGPPFADVQNPVARSPAETRRAVSRGDTAPTFTTVRVIRPRPPPPAVVGNSRGIAPSPAGTAIRTPAGTDFVPVGSIRTPGGTVWTPKGSCYSPGGTGYWPAGTQETPEGGMLTPSGTLYTQEGIGYGPAGHVYTPGGTTYSPSGVAYSTWAGQYRYQQDQPASPPPPPSPTPPFSAAMSPPPPDQAPILAAQRTLRDTLIGNAGAPVESEPPSPQLASPQLASPSQHPPTPYHTTSPLQLASPAVYGAPAWPVMTADVSMSRSPSPAPPRTIYTEQIWSPVAEASPGLVRAPSPGQLPAPSPPATYPAVLQSLQGAPVSPGMSPQPLELRPSEFRVTSALQGPVSENRKITLPSLSANERTYSPSPAAASPAA
eukprot:Gregarina_sp_Poly_1__8469@NODE_499_length_7894_cov_59_656446_g399_i0_p2_GENE_NODE_499_length_7894_cov_59_656446_g399_i0NODE_499_length_7894_cov_59_656446_g399_i0_p2_ORF_typecomplete_len467_score86_34_NODE_499_length_7894_cov_59_656446_g399_i011502550